MSNQSPFGGRGRVPLPSLPKGEAVATYETYVEAQQAVDVLARADFPVNKLSIVGSNLKTVERVTGKLTWGRVALAGAASGAWLGIFFGLLLVIFSPTTNMGFIFAAVLIGAGFGMLFGLVSYAINRRRRDFTSMTQVLASRYEVIVDPSLMHRARNLLGTDAAGVAPAGYAASANSSDPPRPPDRSAGQGDPGAEADAGQDSGSESEPRPNTGASSRDEPPRYGERSE